MTPSLIDLLVIGTILVFILGGAYAFLRYGKSRVWATIWIVFWIGFAVIEAIAAPSGNTLSDTIANNVPEAVTLSAIVVAAVVAFIHARELYKHRRDRIKLKKEMAQWEAAGDFDFEQHSITRILSAWGLLEDLMQREPYTATRIFGSAYLCGWDFIARCWIVDCFVPREKKFKPELFDALAEVITRFVELEKDDSGSGLNLANTLTYRTKTTWDATAQPNRK